jgi:ketosteroid isomerase-like protein
MKRMLLIALVSIVASCTAWAQEKAAKPPPHKKAAGSIQDEIKKLEEDRNQAILRNDTAALDRMTTDNYTLINQRGELLTKAQILDGFKSAAIKFNSRELSDLNVRVYGNTAVVTGRVTQKATENGKDTSGENRFTRVYVKEKGRWVSTAMQITAVAKQ